MRRSLESSGMGSEPIGRVVLAGVVGAAGLVVAAVSSNPVLRVLAIVVAVVVVALCVLSLRSTHPRQAVLPLFVVPLLAVVAGVATISVGNALREPVAPGVGDPGFSPRAAGTGGVADRIAANPDAALHAALDRADGLVPNGSATVLNIGIDGERVSVAAFDPSTGDEVSSSYSPSNGWSPPRHRRAHVRDTFSRAQVAGLALDKARPAVFAMAAQLKADLQYPHASDGITVARRNSDGKLVAEFSLSGNEFEVDERGRLADTAGAALLDTVMALAQRVMVESGLDPGAPIVERFDFRAFDDAASSISASSVQNSGGFVVRLAAGPVADIVVVPGAFPVIRSTERTYAPAGFALTALRTETLLRVRDDIMARGKSPAYDAELVGLEVGRVPGARDDTPAIRMQVGPSANRPAGVYTLDGQLVRSGRY